MFAFTLENIVLEGNIPEGKDIIFCPDMWFSIGTCLKQSLLFLSTSKSNVLECDTPEGKPIVVCPDAHT